MSYFCPTINEREFSRLKLNSSSINFHENPPKEPSSSVQTDGRTDERTEGRKDWTAGHQEVTKIFGFAVFKLGCKNSLYLTESGPG